MNIRLIKTSGILAAWITASLFFQHPAYGADAPENYQVVDGIAIYLGVIPSELIQGHPKKHTEQTMHGQAPPKRGIHAVVALYYDRTGERIEDATVTGSVMELGLSHQDKSFEPMSIADTITFGNYFSMPSNNIYHIKLSILLKTGELVEAKFTHRHYTD